MPDKLAARVSGHADTGELAIGRAMESALAAQRLYEAAAEKGREAVRHLADAGAAFASVRAASSGYLAPLPGTPANPAEVTRLDPPPDHPTPPPVRGALVLAASLLGLGLSALAITPLGDDPVSIESGKAALRHKNWVKAEAMFHRAGDELGVAEALIDEKRYDEAALICERYPQDGKSKLFLGLIARARGDTGGAIILLKEASALGNKEARDLLAFEAKT